MKNKAFWICIVFLGTTLNNSFSQLKSLEYEDFITLVKNHHPIARQATIKAELGDEYVLKSKGNFDPKLSGNFNQKYYTGSQYYSKFNGGFYVPTWFGIAFQAGYDNYTGVYANDEFRTPNNGLWYAGATLDLGNGLIVNQRRTELKQARIYQQSTLVEQKVMMNQLLFNASSAYYDWFNAYNKLLVYQSAEENARLRFEGVRESALLGDKPYIDTVEAFLQVQNRLVQLEQAKMDFQNKKDQLEIYLWQDGMIPIEIDSSVVPVQFTLLSPFNPELYVFENIDNMLEKHPEIVLNALGIEFAQTDLALKREFLKPTLQLKYNAIHSPTSTDFLTDYTSSNYIWGANFSYPIFTRKERGALHISKLELQDQQLKLSDKKAQVRYKIEMARTTWFGTYRQNIITSALVNNYQRLYESEMELFNIGESSIFMINSRDQSLIDSRIKLIELITSSEKAKFNYQLVSYSFVF